VDDVLDMMKGYLQLAAGLGEMSRRKAMDAARELVTGAPVAGLGAVGRPAPEAVAAQVTAVADELMAIGRQNRRLLAQLVRTETEAVLASLGRRSEAAVEGVAGRARLDEQLQALRDRVRDLERQLKDRAAMPSAPAPGRASRRTSATKAARPTAATGTAGRPATTRKATTRKATAGRTTGGRTTAGTTTARGATPATTTARKSAARTTTAAKTTARKSAARTTTAGTTAAGTTTRKTGSAGRAARTATSSATSGARSPRGRGATS
jgi:hypothetical protein